MFKEHNPIINQHLQACPENFIRAGAFILASIQQPFDKMGDQLDSIDTQGLESIYLWGMKSKGYADLLEKGYWLHAELMDLYQPHYDGWIPAALMLIADNITGLGLVKAGFMLQLMFGVSGCIDTRNRLEFNVPLNALNYDKGALEKTRYRKACDYLELCSRIGNSQFIWDNWCNGVAETNYNFDSGEHVSLEHLQLLVR